MHSSSWGLLWSPISEKKKEIRKHNFPSPPLLLVLIFSFASPFFLLRKEASKTFKCDEQNNL
jgi:hypothetical protein